MHPGDGELTHQPLDTGHVAQQEPLPPAAETLDSWALVLLSRVQSGDTIDQARERSGSRVSRVTISRYGATHPDWYRRLMDAQQGAVTGQPVTPSHVARARATGVIDRMADMAMGTLPGVVPRDQVAAGRVVLEATVLDREAGAGAGQALDIRVRIVPGARDSAPAVEVQARTTGA